MAGDSITKISLRLHGFERLSYDPSPTQHATDLDFDTMPGAPQFPEPYLISRYSTLAGALGPDLLIPSPPDNGDFLINPTHLQTEQLDYYQLSPSTSCSTGSPLSAFVGDTPPQTEHLDSCHNSPIDYNTPSQKGQFTYWPNIPYSKEARVASFVNRSPHGAVFPTPSTDADVYPCMWSGTPCGRMVAGNRGAIAHHLIRRHKVKLDHVRDNCLWNGCGDVMRRDSFARHILKHLGIKWQCSMCHKPLARNDSTLRHADHTVSCNGAHVVEMRGPEAVFMPCHNQ
ncbi:hypothetical protein BJ138DRAFT_667313 [Hygrophoropsis aurantiaca]|uniref:Uncharacterized protein n=1 Tax=Hygrophoropsis aurantiaca TaxID=72124 RepID=A0ACB8AIV1_9AGAM|nr:hypothetical protein BJ138DRAFT_667313 [Hygrophoropsis aurantiaca]